ncbi:MAG: hypothetical protein MZV70_66025 [Desulfobacterales bacterium]|nr:hypothetical protein [Desulfobacterales bacterium]
MPVQTFRTNASSGTAVDVTDYVGGHDPATADAGNAAAGWVLSSSHRGFLRRRLRQGPVAFAPVTSRSSTCDRCRLRLQLRHNLEHQQHRPGEPAGSSSRMPTRSNGDASLAATPGP